MTIRRVIPFTTATVVDDGLGTVTMVTLVEDAVGTEKSKWREHVSNRMYTRMYAHTTHTHMHLLVLSPTPCCNEGEDITTKKSWTIIAYKWLH